jgi:hypothetical protein
VVVAAFATFAAFADAARIDASAKLTTCLVAFENWSNAAVVAATVDFSAVTATLEPAGILRRLTHAAALVPKACSAKGREFSLL